MESGKPLPLFFAEGEKPSLNANTYYIIAKWSDSGRWAGQTQTGYTTYGETETYGNTWPSSLQKEFTENDAVMHIYCTYTETGGGQQNYNLTILHAGTGSGITNPTTGTYIYPSGTEVTITATANSGSTFAGWSGACTGTGSCSVIMDSDKTVTATFNLVGNETIVYCKQINIDPSYSYTLICDKLVISNAYTNIINCSELQVGDIIYQ